MSKYNSVPVEPVGRVKTVGGYPDESEHTVEWLCKYKDLKDGDLLYTAPQPAEQQPVCPTCYGRGWDMDCQNEFRPATCPDCEGSGKAEHSITVQESDSAAPAVQGESVASPTAGMNLGQRIRHVGGCETERGIVHFGSVMAVKTLVDQVLRDIATAPQPAPDVSGLVDALEKARDAIGSLPQDALGNVLDTQQRQGWHIRDELINDISTALSAHRKQGDGK